MDKNTEIKNLIVQFCKEKLDAEYLRLCELAYDKLIKKDPEIFKKGNTAIWAASIVWAVGSVNFLDDKSFLPYASLTELCDWFATVNSTVGQKASLIRNILKMSQFDKRFMRKDSDFGQFLDKFFMTSNGIIMMEESEDENSTNEKSVEQEEPSQYVLKLTTSAKLTNALVYQLEYLFKKSISTLDQFLKIEIAGPGTIHIYFFGQKSCVNDFSNAIKSTSFIISELTIYNEDNPD